MTEKGSGGRMRVKGSWKWKAGGGGVRRYEVRGRVVHGVGVAYGRVKGI